MKVALENKLADTQRTQLQNRLLRPEPIVEIKHTWIILGKARRARLMAQTRQNIDMHMRSVVVYRFLAQYCILYALDCYTDGIIVALIVLLVMRAMHTRKDKDEAKYDSCSLYLPTTLTLHKN